MKPSSILDILELAIKMGRGSPRHSALRSALTFALHVACLKRTLGRPGSCRRCPRTRSPSSFAVFFSSLIKCGFFSVDVHQGVVLYKTQIY